jgi:hypothetical protein
VDGHWIDLRKNSAGIRASGAEETLLTVAVASCVPLAILTEPSFTARVTAQLGEDQPQEIPIDLIEVVATINHLKADVVRVYTALGIAVLD